MRSWMLAAALVSSLAFAVGCSDGGEGGTGGGGGGGGSDGEGGTGGKPPTATVAATGTTSGAPSTGSDTTSTSTGGDSCDDIGVCENASDPQDINTCSACAQLGPCQELAQKCTPETPCRQFLDCAVACGQDGTCQQACGDDNPQGYQDYVAVFRCVVCEQCANSCSGTPTAQGCE